MTSEVLHTLVQMILERSISTPEAYDWSIQGFGMLRLYLPQDMRINIWHSKFRVPDVSLIHTHPWHFTSLIERGRLTNIRYELTDGEPTHEQAPIKPGQNGGITGCSKLVSLQSFNPEFYGLEETYSQRAHEIHLSSPQDGCVTINKRARVGADQALVFWSVGKSWVSAEPRKANADEIRAFCLAAIDRNPLLMERM